MRPDEKIDVKEFSKRLIVDNRDLVIDVRPELHFEICNLPNTINFPYDRIVKGEYDEKLKEEVSKRVENSKG